MKIVAADYRTGGSAGFALEGRAPNRKSRQRTGRLLTGPAFVDLQCNGFVGIDFTRPETTPEQVCEAVRAMWKTGCASVVATVITASPERLEHLLRTLVAAREMDGDVRRSVPGFHLEAPFISGIDGARGAHPREHVRPADMKLWRRLQRAAEGLIRIVTIAPEVPGAVRLIRALQSEGVVVALGHTMASREEVGIAVREGAVMSTHLGNGCPQMLHRHDNPVLAQLGEDLLAASFIADGIHLPFNVLQSFVRAKPPGKALLVTDAMAAAGAPPGRYTIGDLEVEVGEDRVVRQPGSPNFAGSALTMNDAVANVARSGILALADAWDAASVRPAKLLALGGGRVHPARIIAEYNDHGLEVTATIRAGRVLFARGN